MRNLLLAVFVLACAFSAVAQNKHPFTFEDMMALKRVEEPVPSPDGKWVLFAGGYTAAAYYGPAGRS